MFKTVTITIASILLAISGAGTANAAAQTVSVDDPVGDFASPPNGQNLQIKPYFDMVRAEVSKQTPKSNFTMTMDLAEGVPLEPPVPPGKDAAKFIWTFGIDVPPLNQDIVGDPFPPGQGEGRRFDYFVILEWDGSQFKPYVLDRTPLLADGEAKPSDPIPYSFNSSRTQLTFVVSPSLVGNPKSFSWLAITNLRKAHDGSDSNQPFDFVGASWPN
jgi:hypothetical protein